MALQVYLCVLILAFSLCHGSITNKPADIEACVGEDVNIPWTYDDNDVGITVKWSHEGTTIMTYLSGVHTPRNSYTVVNHGTGNITLSSVPLSYSGAYKIDITAVTSSVHEVGVTVCAASAGLTFSKSGQTITCEASDLGTPAATLSIWIDGIVDQSSSSATVTDLNEVRCCLSGCAVSCMNGGSSSATESCIVVQDTVPPTTNQTNGTTEHTNSTPPTPDMNMETIIIVVAIICGCGHLWM